MGLKVFNGSSWSSQASNFSLYNGSSWTQVQRGYVYDGTQWRQFWPEAPANIAAPTISGITSYLGVGQTATCSTGTWTNSGTITYQWQRAFWSSSSSWSNISGATSSSYFAGASQTSYDLRCAVTNTNARGATTVFTSNTGVIPAAILTGLTGSKQGQNKALLSWNPSLGAGAYLIQYQYVGIIPLTNVYTTSTSYFIDASMYPNAPSIGPSVTPAGPNSDGFPSQSGWGGYPGFGQNVTINWP